jgi:electron transport complex protein RnfB
VLALGGTLGGLIARGPRRGEVWQIDPEKCIKCERCATECVLTPSAVKCVHAFAVCGYCQLCFGYYAGDRVDNSPNPENRMCPTNAIARTFIEDPYYQYVIDENKCIGCSRCVKGCEQFGNGSLYLQVRHDRCLNCNECAIARACPAQAFVRVPANEPYLLKGKK